MARIYAIGLLLFAVGTAVLLGQNAATARSPIAQQEASANGAKNSPPATSPLPQKEKAETNANPYRIDRIPPLPPGVEELRFEQIYKMPAGPLGLEFTDTARSLDGKRVRILGYMVRSVHPNPRAFQLSPYPVTFDRCTADSIPTSAIHVYLPAGQKAVFTEGMLLLTGKLSLGSQEDPFGQTSHVRLLLDPPEQTKPAPSSPAAQTSNP